MKSSNEICSSPNSILKDALEHGRRTTIELLHGRSIKKNAPQSADVPRNLSKRMPNLFDRFPMVFPWQRRSLPVDPTKHAVWLLDNTAFPTPRHAGHPTNPERVHDDEQEWQTEFIACYFVKHSGRDQSRIVADIAHKLNVNAGDYASQQRIAARLEPFADTILINRTSRIALPGLQQQSLGPSNKSGISTNILDLHLPPRFMDSRRTRSFTVQNSCQPLYLPPSTTTLAEEHGWMIISDVDDTIKLTLSNSAFGILYHTFLIPSPLPIRGMPALYSHLQNILHDPAFFYLSASPYNLYPFLHRFLYPHMYRRRLSSPRSQQQQHHRRASPDHLRTSLSFPMGTLLLRDASWQNLAGLLTSLTQGIQNYKISRMAELHSRWPHRKVICIGDSSQTDPEAYAEVVKRWPGWVKGVFIRKVPVVDEDGDGLEDEVAEGRNPEWKNSDERFEKAFEGVERNIWKVFEAPDDVGRWVEKLVQHEARVDANGGRDGDDGRVFSVRLDKP
ncbi:uncharacterized protein K489DRAFT_377756 [Dissoconium aciculare CBS 342.82]|uniref:Phosphatidate phosphatase APP1 catalytic domain-containing protein n=1 Tax=Dissoconium aciculare CBS 342.82 TaxID=1314786 RepID=A0A6J3MB08_9PEZI|nr:uncharacterized protein K489DRAFT_377756 [Dissoconium aciculare CBS 342.82]KAF1825206.1 hypothetical protein K489DRAFT_377756 [Dissoconium aciculare CBS 342.82]